MKPTLLIEIILVLRRAMLFWIAALICTGCIAYRIAAPGTAALHLNNLSHPYAAIEFGEQGDARDPQQIALAKAAIAKLRKPLTFAGQ